MSTHAFERLKEIRFLGGIDYQVVPVPNGARKRYTRYQHSLGVAGLALYYAQKQHLSPSEQELGALLSPALLHDIGHAPLSHSLEPVFLQHFNLDHHNVTIDIITGRSSIGREVYQVLRDHKVDVNRLTSVISGEDHSFDGFFDGPINFDTIEAILRSQSYISSHALLPNPASIVDAAMMRTSATHQRLVDKFWNFKDQVYRLLVNSPRGILADHISQIYMRRYISKFTKEDYLTTEKQIFRKLPGLKPLLTSRSFTAAASRYIEGSISYRARRFVIDERIDFFGRRDRGRYLQSKHECRLSIEKTTISKPNNFSRDFFDEGIRNK